VITLGIETSCDETACAVLYKDERVLSSVVSSQIRIHRPFKGVVPEIACREHVRTIQPVLERALKQAGLGLRDCDLISVTNGPGLVGALMIGVSMAKSLSQATGIPLVGVNHLEAHLEPCFLGAGQSVRRFPFIGLVASGGHTCLVEAHSVSSYHLLGQTRDDAAGEAFDKVAKLLGLGFPGGPAIEKWAKTGNAKRIRLPEAMPNTRFDFSFSGLKTAVLYFAQDHGLLNGAQNGDIKKRRWVQDLCASFQQVVIESLVRKSVSACKTLGIRRLVVGGGVAANQFLKQQLTARTKQKGIQLYYPHRKYTTDNAVMVCLRGYRLARAKSASKLGSQNGLSLSVDPSLGFINGEKKR
jgi:N6-L-threonylcarbamoyladenine synthase